MNRFPITSPPPCKSNRLTSSEILEEHCTEIEIDKENLLRKKKSVMSSSSGAENIFDVDKQEQSHSEINIVSSSSSECKKRCFLEIAVLGVGRKVITFCAF